MKYVTTRKMQELDRIAIEQYKIPSLLLMENAGRGIAELGVEVLSSPNVFVGDPDFGFPLKTCGNDRKKHKILVVCGKGNNGGDGFVAARHLSNKGFPVQVVLIGKSHDLKSDPKINFMILKNIKVPVLELSRQSFNKFRTLIRQSSLVIDAIFGIGLSRNVDGLFREAISEINRSKKPVLAIDVPSGINSDTGEVMGAAVRAQMTGTLAALKAGLVKTKGPKHAGTIKVLDISIPRRLLK